MNQIANQFNDFVRDGQLHVPEPVRDLVGENLAKARTAWSAGTSTIRDATTLQQNVTKALGDHALQCATKNIDATLDAVQALSKSQTIAEVQKIQTAFVQEQMARWVDQSQMFMELAGKVSAEISEALPRMINQAKTNDST